MLEIVKDDFDTVCVPVACIATGSRLCEVNIKSLKDRLDQARTIVTAVYFLDLTLLAKPLFEGFDTFFVAKTSCPKKRQREQDDPLSQCQSFVVFGACTSNLQVVVFERQAHRTDALLQLHECVRILSYDAASLWCAFRTIPFEGPVKSTHPWCFESMTQLGVEAISEESEMEPTFSSKHAEVFSFDRTFAER